MKLNSQFTPDDLLFLQANFYYNPENGNIYRLYKDSALLISKQPKEEYISVQFGRKKIKGHRLAWFLYYGALPPSGIDHKNRIKTDNRIENLRLANASQNCINSGKFQNGSKSKYKGVTWNKKLQKWQSFTYYHGKHIYIGAFNTELEAHLAYRKKINYLFKEFSPYNDTAI